ncbi:HET-domain-containing protein, partial [Plenodomus tracheiphilus IPT5]
MKIPAKRVLDITDAAENLVRLVETTDLEGRYVALSHCWGHPSRHPLMTVHATLNDHMASILVEKLPQSFRDAITVCQHLGVKYIWIDCLCIIQVITFFLSWLAEAEKMADIYSKSYLTVAASRAYNSQHGFLFDFPADTVRYESTPLNRRAWCLQEWYLPKRLVEFAVSNLRLICLRSVETRFGKTSDERTKTRTIARGWGMRDEAFFRTLWESIRQDLFARDITRTSDKLPAMAGLAQMLEKRLFETPNHRYLAGLWSTRISEDLSWTVLEYDDTSTWIEGVPTWSWASTSNDSDIIYGRPSDTYVELIEARCT